MPFVHDQTGMTWPDDGTDPPPSRLDQFQYHTPLQMGGTRDPVRFDFPQANAAPSNITRDQVGQTKPRSLLDRLFGSPPGPSSQPQPAPSANDNSQSRLYAIMIPALRAMGATRALCRYDGGNDEGFSWLERVELRDGTLLNADALAQKLLDLQIHEKIYTAGILTREAFGGDQKFQLKAIADDWLCAVWATLLLGSGFGTGEYAMFGAFSVDLDTCLITDDPKADPIVEHIAIAK
jgi:hypothetical protein